MRSRMRRQSAVVIIEWQLAGEDGTWWQVVVGPRVWGSASGRQKDRGVGVGGGGGGDGGVRV